MNEFEKYVVKDSGTSVNSKQHRPLECNDCITVYNIYIHQGLKLLKHIKQLNIDTT